MKINVKCYEVKNGGNLKGTASIGIDDKLYIKGFRIMNGSKGLFVSFPSVKHSTNKGEFIETIMNEGCPAYVRKASITPAEAAELIRSAGGKAVLAHPVAYKYEDGLTDDEILELVKEMKVEAIEANYHYVDRNNNRVDESSHWRDFANKHNLICTVGSDFHSDDGIKPVIGFKNWDI